MVNYPLFPPQNEDVVGFARLWWHLRQAGAGNGVLIDSNDPNGMKVTRASASSVNVAAGHYANKGTWKAYAGASPAIDSIPAASAGYHRYDSICVKLSDNTIVRVAGTEAVPDDADDFLENFTPLPADLNSTDYIELAILCIDEDGIRSTDNGSYSVGGVCDTRPPFVFGLDDATLKISADGKLEVQYQDGWIAAGETWTYASADDPTFTFTISGDKSTKYYPGMRVKLTQTTEKYFIITKVVYSDPNTTVTVYGGTDYDLADAAITSPYFSMMRYPAGFPFDPAKWSVLITDSGDYDQPNPASGTWYNLGSLQISIPIGLWNVSYKCMNDIMDTGEDTKLDGWVALSSSTTSISDDGLSARNYVGPHTGASPTEYTGRCASTIQLFSTISLSSKTTYYLICRSVTGVTSISIYSSSGFFPIIIQAVSAYL